MSIVSSKESGKNAYPTSLSSIVAIVGGLAVFLILASTVLIQQPIGSTVRGYFSGVDSSAVADSNYIVNPVEDRGESNLTILGDYGNKVVSLHGDRKSDDGNVTVVEKQQPIEPNDKTELSDSGKEESKVSKEKSQEPTVTREDDGKGTVIEKQQPIESDGKTELSDLGKEEPKVPKEKTQEPTVTREDDGKGTVIGKEQPIEPNGKTELSDSGKEKPKDSKEKVQEPRVTREDDGTQTSYSSDPASRENAPISSNERETDLKNNVESAAATTTNSSQSNVFDSGCDLYHGKWIYDSAGALYSNNSCPVLTQMQNCQGNGRPDKEYENWRWKPSQCDLPRFDPKEFLELMRGKTLAFIGDSVARNQMESLLCILWQVEVPKNRGNKKMQRYYFRSTSTMIIRIWSSWLVHHSPDPFDFAPAGVGKLHLDKPDESFMDHITTFDVIVLSSGHWFAKQSAYILNDQIVGGQLWWPEKSREMKVNNIEAFGISVETILTAIGTHPNFTGLAIVRSYSPDHYEGGAWNTGGSCTGKVRPASEKEVVENRFTNIMHEKQVAGFNQALEKKTNKAKLKLMDITEMFSYRHDGHPGPYRSPDPNKVTKRGPDGRPPPQDCLHWCMPGPVDTWNELVFENIRREFRERRDDSS